MAGVELPLQPTGHQYLVTKAIRAFRNPAASDGRAQWIVEGAPHQGMVGRDTATVSGWSGVVLTKALVRDQYAKRFKTRPPPMRNMRPGEPVDRRGARCVPMAASVRQHPATASCLRLDAIP